MVYCIVLQQWHHQHQNILIVVTSFDNCDCLDTIMLATADILLGCFTLLCSTYRDAISSSECVIFASSCTVVTIFVGGYFANTKQTRLIA